MWGRVPCGPTLSMRRTALLTALLASLAVPAVADAAVRHVIRGAGFGHGIGMSQYGAYGYSLEGAKYPGILAHYYKGTRLSSAPERPVRVLLQPVDPYIRVRGATSVGGRELKPSRIYVAKRGAGGIVVTTASGKRVARFGSIVSFRVGGPDAAHGPRAQLRDQRPLPRGHRGARGRQRRDRHQRARHGQLPARSGGGRDAEHVAARGAQGAGRGRAHVRARHAQDRRRLRPVPRHALAGLSRRDRGERAQRRRRERHRRAHRDLRRRAGRDLLLLHLRGPHRERGVLVRRVALEAVARGSAGPV